MRTQTVSFALFTVLILLARTSAADFRTDCEGFERARLETTTVLLTSANKRAEVRAEVAATNREKQRGLMCRKKLPDGNAMLFPFDEPQTGGFWMFNTYLDLDILYIAKNGEVVEKVRMKKCPRKTGESTPEWATRCSEQARDYRPAKPYTATLEIPAGYLERRGFSPRQPVTAKWRAR